jgi:hypothetical protein
MSYLNGSDIKQTPLLKDILVPLELVSFLHFIDSGHIRP